LGEPLRGRGVLALRAALASPLASGYPLHHPPQSLHSCLRVVPLLSLSQQTQAFLFFLTVKIMPNK
jgi:hypothetical protein